MKNWIGRIIRPHSSSPDDMRRELVLNSMLVGLVGLATLALAYSASNYFVLHASKHVAAFVATTIFWAFTLLLLVLSRRGYWRFVSIVFVSFLLIVSTTFAVIWGFGLAIATLFFAVTILAAGVLFTARLALYTSLLVGLVLAVVAFLQISDRQTPAHYWQVEGYVAADAIGFIAIFLVMGYVSWLSNRERDRSLVRARRSEAELQIERDNLEKTVARRTAELEDLQLAKVLELQAFAEFGRIGAGLVHDIATPLTAVGLQLEALSKDQHSALLRQLQRNMQQLERYLQAARKQIQHSSPDQLFSPAKELRAVVRLVRHRSRLADVGINLQVHTNQKMFGDPAKFSRIAANIIMNALESTEAANAHTPVTVLLESKNKTITLRVIDEGLGIPKANIDRIFEPFFSTKKDERSGLGIGLAMVRQFIETDFNGMVAVRSDPDAHTEFSLTFKGKQKHARK